MITQHGWMFLSSFESMRNQVASNRFVNMAHLGPRAFEEIGGEVVQTVCFVLSKQYVRDFKGTYCRLVQPNTQEGKEKMFLSKENRYIVSQDAFNIIPGNPIAYWASNTVLRAYKEGRPLATIAEPKQGLKTGNNDTFLRLWHEIDLSRFSIYCDESTAKWLIGCWISSFFSGERKIVASLSEMCLVIPLNRSIRSEKRPPANFFVFSL